MTDLYGAMGTDGHFGVAKDATSPLMPVQQDTSAPEGTASYEGKMYGLLLLLVVANTALVGVIGAVGWSTYVEMQAVAKPFSALSGGLGVASSAGATSTLSASPDVSTRLKDTLSSAATFFIFGDATDAVAAFVGDLLQFNFTSLAAVARTFGSQMVSTFHGQSCSGARVFCNTTSPYPGQYNYPTLHCPPMPGYPNGRDLYYQCVQYPNPQWAPPSRWIDCSTIGCPFPALETVGGAISAVSANVGQVVLSAAAEQENVGAAAFSSGVFRLDGILRWVQSQLNATAWASAGATCGAFFSQLQAFNWSSCFISQNQSNCWDVNKGAQQFFNRSAELCNVLAKLNSTR